MKRFIVLLVWLPSIATAQAPEEEEEAAPHVEIRPGHGLEVETADEQFGFSIRARTQLLGEVAVPSGENAELGVAVRRARVTIGGHIFGPDTRFKLQLGLAPADLAVVDGVPTRTPILDCYLELTQLRDLEVRAGQYVVPFTRERVTSSGNLELVDRSESNRELTLDRDLMVHIQSRDFLGAGWLRYYAGVGFGEGRDGGMGNDFGLLYFVRLEAFPLGLFDDTAQGDVGRSSSPHLAFGAAYAFLDRAHHMRGTQGPAPDDGGFTRYHYGTADVVFAYQGFSAYAEATVRDGWRRPGQNVDDAGLPIAATPPRNALGWIVQLGYVLPVVDLGIAVRAGMVHPLGDDSSAAVRGELGGGLTYYFAGHPYKVQLDYFHLWDDAGFTTGEERVRLQLSVSL